VVEREREGEMERNGEAMEKGGTKGERERERERGRERENTVESLLGERSVRGFIPQPAAHVFSSALLISVAKLR